MPLRWLFALFWRKKVGVSLRCEMRNARCGLRTATRGADHKSGTSSLPSAFPGPPKALMRRGWFRPTLGFAPSWENVEQANDGDRRGNSRTWDIIIGVHRLDIHQLLYSTVPSPYIVTVANRAYTFTHEQ